MSKKTDSGLGCLILFASPFAAVGVVACYLIAASLFEWASMRAWVEVPAEIVSARLEPHAGSDGDTTYEAVATYRYTYQGRELSGNRVTMHSGADNIGSFQKDVYAELSQARGGTLPCYVNPENPAEAILYREPSVARLGFYAIFMVLFGGVGFGLMAAALSGSRKLKREEAQKALHPGEPWLHNEDWQDGRIRSSAKARVLFTLGFAGVWNLVSMPIFIFAHDEIFDPDNRIALLALVFPVAGIALGFWAVKSVLRYMKFGESTFEMATIPGVIGGPLSGLVRTSVPVAAPTGFDVKLSSIHRYTSGTGKNRSTRENVLWQKSYKVAYDRARSGIPIAFQIPYDCKSTDVEHTNDKNIWKLELSADVPGVDYHAEFEVPVFRTEHSSDQPITDEDVESIPGRIEEPLAKRLEKSRVHVELLPSGKRFHFPMARQLGSALGLSAFFLVWSAIVVGLWVSDAPRLFPYLFGFFDLLILYGVLDMWFYSSRIEVRPGEMRFAGGLFGGGSKRLVRGEIESIRAKRGMQSGNKLFYQLELEERGGKKHTLAKRLPDLDTAEECAADIETILG